ncbi:MAG TPA: hypothetical protein VKU19_24940 [Bryobacteraceae bacterium]|nr:hypothetical protein [Bryobacteraceae bacterium]
MNYDIVAGMDNGTLNQLVKQVYSTLYPSIFKDTISVGQLGIASLGFDFNVAPTTNLQPSAEFRDYVADYLAKDTLYANVIEADRSTMLELAAAASFGVKAPSVVLTVAYQGGATPTTVKASLSGSINIQTQNTGGQNYLTVQIATANVSIPGDPALAGLLNNAIVPQFLIPYLNKNLLGPIKVPALQFSSLVVSMPAPAVQSPFVTAYSALGTAQPTIPPPNNWPANCVFTGVNTNAITKAAAIPFPLGPSTGFNWEIISGTVGAQVTAPTNISINSDGSISASITAYARCQLTLHTPNGLPNVDFGPSAQATIAATLRPSVVNQQVCFVMEGIPIPRFSFSWGIPSWIAWLFDPLAGALSAALNAILGPLIGNVLKLPPIPVYTIPTISFTAGGKSINIKIAQATTSSRNSLLMVSAQLTVS